MKRGQGTKFTPELEQWLAYAVLTGHSNESVLGQLTDSGYPADEIVHSLNELRESPLLTVGHDFARQLSQARWLLDLQKSVFELARVKGDVPRIEARDYERFAQDFLAANRPVIIDGLIDNWPAKTCWDHQSLNEKLGRERIQYTRYFVEQNRHMPEKMESSFGEFLDLVFQEKCEDPIYWTAYNQGDEASALLSGLQEDIVFPEPYCTAKEGMRTYFWIGPKGTRSGLHFDPYNVLFVQVKGRKRFYLFPPQDIPKAYLENDFFSQVDAEAPDLGKFPKFSGLEPIIVEVGPGETLFLPVGWLHQVRSLSVSISVSLTCLNLPSGGSNRYDAPSTYRGIL